MKKPFRNKIIICSVFFLITFFIIYKFGFYDKKELEEMNFVRITYYHNDGDYYNRATMDQKFIYSQKTMARIKGILKQQTFIRTWRKPARIKEEKIVLGFVIEDEYFECNVFKASNDKSILVMNDRTYKCNDIWNDLYNILTENTDDDILEYNVKW